MFLSTEDFFEMRKLVFLDHLDLDGVMHILAEIMCLANKKYMAMHKEKGINQHVRKKRSYKEMMKTNAEEIDTNEDIL